MKILLVDDSMSARFKCKNLLVSHNYDVIEAENGDIAIEKYKEETPDLVLMDVIMPDMDGITATKEILKIDPNAKIIMLTTMGQQKMITEMEKAGAKEFILKPFKDEKLLATLNKYLNSTI